MWGMKIAPDKGVDRGPRFFTRGSPREGKINNYDKNETGEGYRRGSDDNWKLITF